MGRDVVYACEGCSSLWMRAGVGCVRLELDDSEMTLHIVIDCDEVEQLVGDLREMARRARNAAIQKEVAP